MRYVALVATSVLLIVAGVVAFSNDNNKQSEWSAPTQWDLVASDGSSLTMAAVIGSSTCGSIGDIDVYETLTVVRIAIDAHTTSYGDCTTDIATKQAQVELQRPLGDRDLEGCRPDNPAYRLPTSTDIHHDCSVGVE